MVKSSLSPPSQHRHSALLHFFLKSNCFPITSLGRAASCGVLERFVTCSCEVLKHPSSKEKGGDKDGNYGVGIPVIMGFRFRSNFDMQIFPDPEGRTRGMNQACKGMKYSVEGELKIL